MAPSAITISMPHALKKGAGLPQDRKPHTLSGDIVSEQATNPRTRDRPQHAYVLHGAARDSVRENQSSQLDMRSDT